MTTPSRRSTRSMNRDFSPGPVAVSPVAVSEIAGLRPRATSNRPPIPVAPSLAYGSPARPMLVSTTSTEHAEQNALEAIQASVTLAQNRGLSTIDEGDGSERDTSEGDSSENDEIRIPKVEDGQDSDNESRSFGTEDPVIRRSASRVLEQRKTASAGAAQGRKTTATRKSPHTRQSQAPAKAKRRPTLFRPKAPEPQPPDEDMVESSSAASSRPDDPVEENAPRGHVRSLDVSDHLKSYLLRIWELVNYFIPFLTRVVITVGICYFLFRKYPPLPDLIPSQPQQKPYDNPGSFTRDLTNLMRRVTSLEYALVSPAPPPARVNWFSPGLGAVVDPFLTSPTYKATLKTRSWLRWSDILKKDIGNPDIPGPAKVLRAWDDVGDCWCAPGLGGKSQITIRLPEKIAPTDLVIEHVAIDATLDRGSAPKDVELWVQIEDRATYARVKRAAEDVVQRDRDLALGANQPQLDPGYDYEEPGALDYRTWVRIGVWRYDIYARSNVQSFRIGVDMEGLQAPVETVSLRVRNNWGPKPYTCLYRLKLHGLLAEQAE